MNLATSMCNRFSLKHLVTVTPVYSRASDVTGEGLSLMFRRWAAKKMFPCIKNNGNSNPKYLRVKKFHGEVKKADEQYPKVIPGNIIVRQRGTKYHPGNHVGLGKDHTLFAMIEGRVKFEDNKLNGRRRVHVEP